MRKFCHSNLIAFCWLILVSLGNFALLAYSNQSLPAQAAPQSWPKASKISFNTQKPTLLMFAHPQCPCTRASIEELSELMTIFKNKLEVYLVFIKPKKFSEAWLKSNLWQQAKKIPGINLINDHAGIETKLFKARTSGEVLLYDPLKHLVFQGGITWARGHSGDSLGKSSIQSYLKNKKLENQEAPAFGCALFSSQVQENS